MIQGSLRPEFFYYLIYENFFSDLGTKKEKKTLKMTSQLFFVNMSRTNSETSIKSKPAVCIKSLNISSFSCTGQSLLTVAFSKIHKQNLKNIFFQ